MSDPIEPPGDDDRDAFRRAVADVRPLPRRPRVTPKAPSARPARSSRALKADVLVESHVQHHPAGAAGTEAGDRLAFRRPGVADDLLRKLKRGRIPVEAELDLHGLTRHAAHAALGDFLDESVAQGLRCVRVIHGKGLRSGLEGPVLKEVVDHWLRRVANVAAFVSARPVDGGTGAVYVLLAGPARPARR